jgi:hypothetical protein
MLRPLVVFGRILVLTCALQHYRYWVVWLCPSVRFLDYQKVKEVEREKGRELFGTEEEPTALAAKVSLVYLEEGINPLTRIFFSSLSRSWARRRHHSTHR